MAAAPPTAVPPLPPAVRARLGPAPVRTLIRSRPGGPAVARWAGPRGALIEKVHAHPRPFQQEEAALRQWAPALPAPALVAVEPARRRLWMGCLPGRPVAQPTAALVSAAGRVLARLHALPHRDRDPLPLATALRRRMAAAVARARAAALAVPPALLRLAAAEGPDPLAGARRVPCHRDFTPDNWLSAGPDTVALVDFEHARADLAALDLAKLEGGLLFGAPELRAAFYAGYGPPPPAPLLAGLVGLHGLSTQLWAARHADAALAALGDRAVAAAARLAGAPEPLRC